MINSDLNDSHYLSVNESNLEQITFVNDSQLKIYYFDIFIVVSGD